MTTHLRAVALAGAVAALAVSTAAPAVAAESKYEKAQVGLTYSVYEPEETFGMKLKFKLDECGVPNQDMMIAADYSNASTGQSIELFESAVPCGDGPDGVALVEKFKANGATVKLFGGCPGEQSTCKKSDANVKRFGYATTTFPSGGNGLSKTYLEVYTTKLGKGDVKSFFRSLAFVG